MSIAVIGSVFVDIKGFPHGQFIPQGRNAGYMVQVHGGVSRNVAEDIGRAGFSPVMIGLSDTTGIGLDVIGRLQQSGVDTSHMRRVPNGCGTWIAVFDDQGDVAASVSVRPDLHPVTEILRAEGDAVIAAADSLVVELDLEPETLDIAYALAEKYHKPVYAVISNISIALEQKARLKQTDCFVCNMQEAGIFFQTGLDTLSPEDAARMLPVLIHKEQIPRMVVTMGSEGAVYADNAGNAGFVPARRVAVADTSGAGDAFFSGVVIGLTCGRTLREACEIGTIAASSVITVKDNTVRPEVREEIMTYLSPD